jgi:hypothetical protein
MGPATTETEFEQLDYSITNHTPSELAISNIEQIRIAARVFAKAVIDITPSSREKSLSKTHIEEAVMWAVKSIILGDK